MAAKRVRVLLDSNQWIESLLLRSPTGASLVHYLTRAGATLVLPDVVRQEVEAGVTKRGLAAVEAIERGVGELQRLLGSVREWESPSSATFADRIADRFEQLGSLMEAVELRHEHTTAALSRVIAGERPTVGKREEFRDHLVWLALLDAATPGERTIFVTGDGDFYENGTIGGKLASNLQADVEGLDVEVVGDLQTCLARVAATAPPLDRDGLEAALAGATYGRLAEVVEAAGLQLGKPRMTDVSAFATERPELVAVAFRQEREVRGVSDLNEPWAEVEGEAFFDPSSGEVSGMRPSRFGLRWLDDDGAATGNQTVVVGVGGIHLGVRNVPWTVRSQLPVL